MISNEYFLSLHFKLINTLFNLFNGNFVLIVRKVFGLRAKTRFRIRSDTHFILTKLRMIDRSFDLLDSPGLAIL